MKKIIFLIICLLLITGCEMDDDNKNTYKIRLDKEPYTVCGEKIYFSNDSWNDELDIERIIETITYKCNLHGYENAKDEIDDILNTSDYTKDEILSHLRDAYNMME